MNYLTMLIEENQGLHYVHGFIDAQQGKTVNPFKEGTEPATQYAAGQKRYSFEQELTQEWIPE